MGIGIESVIGAIAGPLIGGMLGGSADAQQGVQEVVTESKPWSGIQPYLIGSGDIPSFLTGMPDMYLPWLLWAQGSGTGANTQAPPPMMADYIRAQLGIGTGGGAIDSPIQGEPVSPAQRVSPNPIGQDPPQQQAPQAAGAMNQIPVFDPQNPGRFLGWSRGRNNVGGETYVNPRTGGLGHVNFREHFAD